jgi:hypothetical protein
MFESATSTNCYTALLIGCDSKTEVLMLIFRKKLRLTIAKSYYEVKNFLVIEITANCSVSSPCCIVPKQYILHFTETEHA